MSKSILINAGGTGGHFFPALVLYRYLKSKNINALLVTDDRCESYIPDDLRAEVRVITVKRFSKNPIKLFKFALSVLCAFYQNLGLILKYKIDVLYCFGGYTSLAPILAAIISFKRIILVEMNIIPGRANLYFAKFAQKIAFAFKDISHFPSKLHNKIEVTGIPVRTVKVKPRDDDYLQIFILGGSQGAQIFSQKIPEILADIPTEIMTKIKIIQQVVPADLKKLEQIYKQRKYHFSASSFYDNANEIMANSDLIISRAGASTLCEIIAYDKNAILFPYPRALDNHQYHNAKYLEKKKKALIVNESNLEVKQVIEKIKESFKAKESLSKRTYNSDEICENLLKLSS